MTLDEAIEILTLDLEDDTSISFLDWQAALKLGIEALKYLKHARQDGAHHAPALLPGETPKGESP